MADDVGCFEDLLEVIENQQQGLVAKKHIAWGPRHQYMETAFKLKGSFPKNGNGNGHDAVPAGNLTVNINLLKASDILDVKS